MLFINKLFDVACYLIDKKFKENGKRIGESGKAEPVLKKGVRGNKT